MRGVPRPLRTAQTTSSRIALFIACVQGVPTFSDDIQATAAVTLAALLGAQRLPGVPPLREQAFLFYGAGQANIGAAQLIAEALVQEGLAQEEATRQIWLMDSQVPYLIAVACGIRSCA